MRPPEFTGGNPTPVVFVAVALLASMRPPEFTGGNRKRIATMIWCGWKSFNEAAGIHRRKQAQTLRRPRYPRPASMRPPEFTGGNAVLAGNVMAVLAVASMRPPEFTGGNSTTSTYSVCWRRGASMRPPEFTGGNRSIIPLIASVAFGLQ